MVTGTGSVAEIQRAIDPVITAAGAADTACAHRHFIRSFTPDPVRGLHGDADYHPGERIRNRYFSLEEPVDIRLESGHDVIEGRLSDCPRLSHMDGERGRFGVFPSDAQVDAMGRRRQRHQEQHRHAKGMTDRAFTEVGSHRPKALRRSKRTGSPRPSFRRAQDYNRLPEETSVKREVAARPVTLRFGLRRRLPPLASPAWK